MYLRPTEYVPHLRRDQRPPGNVQAWAAVSRGSGDAEAVLDCGPSPTDRNSGQGVQDRYYYVLLRTELGEVGAQLKVLGMAD